VLSPQSDDNENNDNAKVGSSSEICDSKQFPDVTQNILVQPPKVKLLIIHQGMISCCLDLSKIKIRRGSNNQEKDIT
jgi:hypothetical protein